MNITFIRGNSKFLQCKVLDFDVMPSRLKVTGSEVEHGNVVCHGLAQTVAVSAFQPNLLNVISLPCRSNTQARQVVKMINFSAQDVPE